MKTFFTWSFTFVTATAFIAQAQDNLTEDFQPKLVHTLKPGERISNAGISEDGKSYFLSVCSTTGQSSPTPNDCATSRVSQNIYVDGKKVLSGVIGEVFFSEGIQKDFWYILYRESGKSLKYLMDSSEKKHGPFDDIYFLGNDPANAKRYGFLYKKNTEVFAQVDDDVLGSLGSEITQVGAKLGFSTEGYLLSYYKSGGQILVNHRKEIFGPFSGCQHVADRAICEFSNSRIQIFVNSLSVGIFEAGSTLGNFFNTGEKMAYCYSTNLQNYFLNIDGKNYGPFALPNRFNNVRDKKESSALINQLCESFELQRGYTMLENGKLASYTYENNDGFYLQIIGSKKIGPYKSIMKPSFSNDGKHWVVGIQEKEDIHIITSDGLRLGPFKNHLSNWNSQNPCQTDYVRNQWRLGFVARHHGNKYAWSALMQDARGNCIPIVSGKPLEKVSSFGFLNAAKEKENVWLMPVKKTNDYYMIFSDGKQMGPYSMVKDFDTTISRDGNNWYFAATIAGKVYVFDSFGQKHGPYSPPFQLALWRNDKKFFVIPLGYNESTKSQELMLNNSKLTGTFYGNNKSGANSPISVLDEEGNVDSIHFLHYEKNHIYLYEVR